jgi:hypothetical protein
MEWELVFPRTFVGKFRKLEDWLKEKILVAIQLISNSETPQALGHKKRGASAHATVMT